MRQPESETLSNIGERSELVVTDSREKCDSNRSEPNSSAAAEPDTTISDPSVYPYSPGYLPIATF